MFLEKIVNVPNKITEDVKYLKELELPLVLYGSAALADHVQKLLLKNEIKLDHVVVDKNYYIPNSFFHTSPIENEEDVLNIYPKVNVIIGFGNYQNKMAELSRNASVERCIFFEPGALQFDFGDYYSTVKKHASDFEKFYSQLADDHSRDVMVAFINAKISGNLEKLVDLNIDNDEQYFPEFIHLSNDEVFVDCGAYDGDTALIFNKMGEGKIYALECDKLNLEKLKQNTRHLKNIEIIEKGCFSRKDVLYFKDGAGEASTVSNQGNVKIEVDALDNMISERVTYLKMDIEGAELEALKGAQNIIRSYRPRLAISVYHRYDDLLAIPQFITELNKSYKFYLRHYGYFCTEVVLYAIPENI